MIGKIFDVFGPVNTPYASIKLNDGVDIGNPDGKPVYLADREKKPDKRKIRRERKSRKSR